MNFQGKNHRISVLILLMEHEAGVTLLTIENLLENSGVDFTISILLNGGSDGDLKKIVSQNDNIFYYENRENLGVAGGRNFLLNTSECKAADIIFILDNDVITPFDYIETLSCFLLTHENVGVVGGIAADIKILGRSCLDDYLTRGIWGGSVWSVSGDKIKNMVLSDYTPDKIFHMGAHADYYYAYFSFKKRIMLFLDRIKSFFGFPKQYHHHLKYNEKLIDEIIKGKDCYKVSNVAGCSQAFKRSLVDNIGPLNDIFNPYGFEDADFCIRALKAGYVNYINTNTWLFHGTDDRHEKRAVDIRYYVLFRGLTLLTALHFNWFRYRLIIAKLLIVEMVYSSLSSEGRKLKNYKAMLSGVKDGHEIVRRYFSALNSGNDCETDNEA